MRLTICQWIFIWALAPIYEIFAQLKWRKSDYTWTEIDEWSSCSSTCGLGNQQKKVLCLKIGTFSETIEPDILCKSLPKPNPIVRNCNLGSCQKVYFWKPSSWGECSQTCGNAGRKTREIDCLYNEGDHKMELSNEEYCDPVLRPQASVACNLLDCPPVFVTGNWGPCVQSRKCLPGKQGRTLDCIILLKTGKTKKISKSPCYKKYFPPPSWRKCFDHINTKECLKLNDRLPEIDINNTTLVQMRRAKKLKLQIGQVAHILLYTSLVLRCPVNHYIAQDLVWRHRSMTYRFLKDKRPRIRVDEKGRLRITKFSAEDQGTWTCVAGPVNGSSFIKFRNPSSGYQDWVLRSVLWNREMLNEAPHTRVAKKDVVQWIIGAWSACSVTCGGEGTQTRDVHCEEIDTRFYTIVNDQFCEQHGQKKPDTKRSCLRPSQCPKWIFTDYDMTKCTDDCMRIGVSKLKGKLFCSFQEKEIDSNMCSRETMPQIGCSNEHCQVTWKKSKWSKCSLSCGGVGIMARYLSCIWRNSGQPAGLLCYQQHIKAPTVIKACIVPKCNLKCLDLITICNGQERLCRLSIYRYMCCSTCKTMYLRLKTRANAKDVYNKIQKNNRLVETTSTTKELLKLSMATDITTWRKEYSVNNVTNLKSTENINSTFGIY